MSSKSAWSRGMIRLQGGRGPGFDSPSGPNFWFFLERGSIFFLFLKRAKQNRVRYMYVSIDYTGLICLLCLEYTWHYQAQVGDFILQLTASNFLASSCIPVILIPTSSIMVIQQYTSYTYTLLTLSSIPVVLGSPASYNYSYFSPIQQDPYTSLSWTSQSTLP